MANKARNKALREQVSIMGDISITSMWERLRGEFLVEYSRLQRLGLSEDEIERALDAFMLGLSDKHLEDLARKASGVTYNQGRVSEMLSEADEGGAEFAIRSEVLDRNTCEMCAFLDGTIVDLADEAAVMEILPPAQCLGGDRCRGFLIAAPAA